MSLVALKARVVLREETVPVVVLREAGLAGSLGRPGGGAAKSSDPVGSRGGKNCSGSLIRECSTMT